MVLKEISFVSGIVLTYNEDCQVLRNREIDGIVYW